MQIIKIFVGSTLRVLFGWQFEYSKDYTLRVGRVDW
jgi:hypothetical protein